MQARHVPPIDPRYWAGITFASIFGTNLGDVYAHDSGLGTGAGVLLLFAVVVGILLIERRDRIAHEIYYWLAIILIRTGATNIADYLDFRLRLLPPLGNALAMAAVIAGFGLWPPPAREKTAVAPDRGKPNVNLGYWVAMLGAGVFGTVMGDVCSHQFGEAASSIGLGVLLGAVLFLAKDWQRSSIAVYWATVAVARTAGTCIGDWFAENKILHWGLTLSTLLTGTAFVAILVLWRSPRRRPRVPA